MRVTSLPRTVADCFKSRNKIGLDVALLLFEFSISVARSPVPISTPVVEWAARAPPGCSSLINGWFVLRFCSLETVPRKTDSRVYL